MAIFTIARDNTSELSNPLTVNLTVGGTANFGTDYTVSGADTFTATTSSITIPAGQLSANITVTPTPDLILEPNETVILSIVPTTGTQTGVNPSATFTIINDERGIVLTYSTNGDTNGLVYYLGTNALTTTFTNPTSIGNLSVLASSTGIGTPASTTDRLSSQWYTEDIAGSWIAWDIGSRTIQVEKYTLRNRNPGVADNLRNWVLEGTNTLSAFTQAGVNTATWTNIDSRINDTTMAVADQFYTMTINGSTRPYRYLRLRQTGLNTTSRNYLVLGEIEFYGNLLE